MREPSPLKQQSHGYEFGPFRYDPREGLVYRDNRRLLLQPKAVDLLRLLLASHGHVVTRDELLRDLWPDVVVEEGNLSKLVFLLRQALSDVPEYADAIETIPKRGYRFVAPVREVAGEHTRLVAVPLEEIAGIEPPKARHGLAAPEQVEDERPRTASRPAQRRLVAGFAALALVAAAALIGTLVSSRARRVTSLPSSRSSIAVLPFINLSDDRADSYFGEGLSDDILTQLAKLRDVRVIGHSSTRAYQGSKQDLRRIRSELGVDTVLGGSVRRAGGRVRIATQLIDARTSEQLWAETYDRDANDVLGVQIDVATQVAMALALRLTPADDARIRLGSTSNPQAYDLYLRSAAELAGWGEGSNMEMAIAHLEGAVALDPGYSNAHARLAQAYFTNGAALDPDNSTWFEKAKAASNHALELEPRLALPHVVQANLLFSRAGGWDLDGAIHQLLRARELEPSLGQLHVLLGELYAHLGLEEAAIRELGLALPADPLSHFTRVHIVKSYELVGHWAEAVERARTFFPGEEAAHVGWRSMIHISQVEEARRALEKGQGVPHHPFNRPQRALTLAVGGKVAEARALVQTVEDSGGLKPLGSYHRTAYDLACTEALLGNSSAAVAWLRKAAEAGLPNYLLFVRDPFLASIRSDPGYMQLIGELKPRWERWRAEYR